MTREEAIPILHDLFNYYNDKENDSYVGFDKEDNEAIRMAIKALEQEPCDDAISRAEAIRIASGYCHHANIPKELWKLPSVLPKQKTGHWIPCTVSSGRDSWECSECGRRARGKIKNLPFCHCGAKMNV